jgi:phosphoglycerate dehydrogenase-like enzyme
MIKVLFIWQPNDKLREYLNNGLCELRQVELIFPQDTKEKTFLNLAKDVDIIVGWRPTKELLYAAEKLSLFINPGAGIQHLIDLFKKLNTVRSVTLINGHGNSYFAAQHAVSMLLTLMNKIILHHNWMVEGKWRKGDADAISVPLRGRTVGLLGYGAVNKKVYRFLSGFEVQFAILKRSWNRQTEQLPTTVAKFDPLHLDTFLKEIDTLIIAVPETSATKGLIRRKQLKLLGSNGLLVNIARGSVVDEQSLYAALKEGIIAGAAIDVWYNYHPVPEKSGKKYPCNFPFHELNNVVLSPHRAASPFDDLKRWDEVIENITRFAKGEKKFINVVNLDREY